MLASYGGKMGKHLAIVFNVIGSVLSLAAAWYWLQSTKTKLPARDNKTGNPNGPVHMSEIYNTVVSSARSNKIAAVLTGFAALSLGAGGLLGALYQ